jgi:hypothetical protein
VWDAFVEDSLVALEREVAKSELSAGSELSLHEPDTGLNRLVAERACHRDTVVAVLDEVELADAVDVDGREFDPLPAGGRHALPAPPYLVRHRTERPVEAARTAIDRPDDRVEPDLLHAEIALPAPAERRHDLLERQQRRHVVRLGTQTRGDARQGAPPALSVKSRLGSHQRRSVAQHHCPPLASDPHGAAVQNPAHGLVRTAQRDARDSPGGSACTECA